jgi:hypothetical protein
VCSKVCRGVTRVGPNEFHRIELRRTNRKGIHAQTRLGLDEILNEASLVNGMVAPDQDNRTGHVSQELLEEEDHVFTTQIDLEQSHRPLYFSSAWADQDCTQKVQSLMVVQTGGRE